MSYLWNFLSSMDYAKTSYNNISKNYGRWEYKILQRLIKIMQKKIKFNQYYFVNRVDDGHFRIFSKLGWESISIVNHTRT